VDQEIAVIAQHPFALFVALDARWPFAMLLQLQADFVGDGLILARVCAGANYKIISEAGDAREIQNSYAGCLLFLRGPNRDLPPGFVLLFCTSTGDDYAFCLRQNSPPTVIVL